jgi:hypothetical protein
MWNEDLTVPILSCIMDSTLRKDEALPKVPYSVTVVDDKGRPTGMLTPDGEYHTNEETHIGQRIVDKTSGTELEIVWDGASKKSLVGRRV